ncbi:MAG: hypothetical protein DME24_19380 [Verrucomicrobia bacterium]|nr:MAG: hypothetical protein DME24_19380 [Verrucomicrobiota bacterium]
MRAARAPFCGRTEIRTHMGIQNRDYMKRPSDGDDGGGSENNPAAAKLERLFTGFLKTHPRFLLIIGVALALLVIIALVIAGFSGKS